jgi:hypothetical protein
VIHVRGGTGRQRPPHADALALTPERNQDVGGGTVAVPQPKLRGQCYVLFTLFAPNGTKFDTKRSQNFTVY